MLNQKMNRIEIFINFCDIDKVKVTFSSMDSSETYFQSIITITTTTTTTTTTTRYTEHFAAFISISLLTNFILRKDI